MSKTAPLIRIAHRGRIDVWRLLTGTHMPALPPRAAPTRGLAPFIAALATTGLAGCDRAPSYSILGSFFPVWLFCFVAGLLLTFVLHLVLQRLRLAAQLAPAVLVYPSLTALFTMALWLIFYS